MNNTPNDLISITPDDAVRKFIQDVGLPLNKAPEALGLSPRDFMSWWAGLNNKIIQIPQLQSLGQFLSIDESEIIDKRYDRSLIRSRIFLDDSVLPERYSQNQFSFLRSSAHILKYLRLTRGQHFSDLMLRKMNVYPLIYDDLNNKISLNFFMDLLDTLADNGLSQQDLDNIACVLFLSLASTPLGEKFKKARNYYECYEVVAQNVHLFDNNFVYSFDLDRTQIRIQAFLPFDVHTHINFSKNRLDRLLRYRRILIGCYPFLSGLTPLFPETTVEQSKYGVNETYVVRFQERGANLLFSIPMSAADN